MKPAVRRQGLVLVGLAMVYTVAIKPADSKPITPASDGTGTIVTPDGDRFDIHSGSLSQDGANLFHSFDKFGLDANQVANFLSLPNIRNILGRVVGGDVSIINGLIQVTGGNSNLFLMNPAGIVFGQNALLNVPADFTATTATGIGFNNGWFRAFGSNQYSNFVGNPNGFRFDGSQPGVIVNAGNLTVTPGHNLNLIGGTVLSSGSLVAPGGSITVSAVPGTSLVRLSQEGQLLSLEIEPLTDSEGNLLAITPQMLPQLLTNGGVVEATGVIVDNNKNIILNQSSVGIPTNTGTALIFGTLDASGAVGGEVNVLGDRIGIINANLNASGMNGGGVIRIGGEYQGSGTVPNASRTYINRNSTINVDALDTGNGGRAIIWADEITGFYGKISARGGLFSGNGGFVEVSGKENLAFNGVVDIGATAGQGGQLLLDPASVIIGTIGTNDTELNDNQILGGDGSEIFQISHRAIENALNTGNVSIAAIKNIDINSNINSTSSNNLTFDAAFINLNASIYLNGGNLTFNAPVILRSSQTLSTGATVGGDITFNSSIHDFNPGTNRLTLEAGTGNVTFNGVVGGALAYNVAVLLNDPVGYWRLDDTGETAFDSSGNGLNGDYKGGVTQNQSGALVGDSNTAPFFNGSTAYVEIRDSDLIDFATDQDFTVTAWVKASPIQVDTDVLDNAIIEKWTGVDGYPFVVRYLNQTTSENGKIRGLQSSDGSNSSGVNSTVTVNDEQFHHIAFLKEGSNISLYIDGILQGTGQDTATGITQNGSPLFLGRRGANNTEFDTFFTGSIDEVAIYNSALSPSAIADQYDVGQGRITAMPLGGLMIANANSITANAAINANSIDMTSNRITLQEFTTTSSGNAVSLTADEINLTGGANSITGIGNLLLQPRTASENIVIAGVEQSGTLDLSLNDLAALSDGFNSITIGRDNSSGAIRVANNVTFQDPVTIQSPVGPGTISANSTIIGLDNASITLTANQDITLQDITTVNNQISIISNSGDIIANSIDAGSDVILKASEGAIRILDTIPSTNLSIRANNSITIESGTPKFTIGDATTNGTALNITDGDGTISATPNFIVPGGIYQHEQGNITIITPLVLPEPSPEPPPEPLPEPLPLDPIISVQPTPPPPLTQTVTDEKNKDLILRTTTREDVARFLDQNQIPEAILFIDILFSEELGAYIEQRTTRELKSFADIQERLNATTSATGTKPAILYTFARPEQLDLVLVTPSGIPIHKSVPTAKREVLLETIADLRRQITNPIKLNTTSYLPAAQQLYQWIIAPLETELKTQGINTIVFAMDTGLRSVPVAALHDGQQFLVENYNLGLIPSLNLTDTRYQSLQDTQILAMGAAQFTDANPLPAVPTELAIITGKLWQGKSFLNQEFTLENLKAQRQEQPFGIIHLATHGEFKPGQPDNSYIHLWDTKLRLDQLRELRWYDPPVELLVLSACRTAVGDEQAELGFAGLAVQAGVKSALGSLWYVSDEGTLGLMSEFYRQLQNAPIKSEALRQAQLGMIQEKVRLEAGELHGSGENLTLPPELAQLGDKNLSHPYYWSAFTMIGSPW